MKQNAGRLLLFAFMSYLWFQSSQGFQKIAWGTGTWLGEYSLKWGMAYLLYILFCVFCVMVSGFVIWHPEKFQRLFDKIIFIRKRLGMLRWLLFFLILIFPVWFFQYTLWGRVLGDIYIRILIWGAVVFLLAVLITKEAARPGWNEYIIVILLTSSEFVIAAPFMEVTNYPFSLAWSEGNRIWDYSIFFGRHLYDYPADREIYVLLDIGRQFVGGLPFIIPGLTIGMERFWIALTSLIPYLLLGLAAFRFARLNLKVWLLGSLWVLIFLKQGPIHTPLVLCAVAVTLLWRSPLWIAIPLIAVTGHIANQSRYTWTFAPGLWIGMLELASAALQGRKLNANSWIRAILLGLVGIAGGLYGQKIAGLFTGDLNVGAEISVSMAVSQVSSPSQPLLWYRLLPNATYGTGIAVGLIIATLPLVALLIYWVSAKKWKPNIWQSLAITAPLLAFLVVGLIVSTKIGGGGDLHNMDMFLIGLVFTTITAWQNGGSDWLIQDKIHLYPFWAKLALVLLLVLPGIQHLQQMRSYNLGENAAWLKTLSDAKRESGMQILPTQVEVDSALRLIQKEVDKAKLKGDVLFIDQRQLLTFGYIKDVPLVPDYEKKLLMNQALSENAAYFEGFYEDLAAKRFSLIINEPLRTTKKDTSAFEFAEENNTWVKWVASPILCYYKPIATIQTINVQLLVPREKPGNCTSKLP